MEEDALKVRERGDMSENWGGWLLLQGLVGYVAMNVGVSCCGKTGTEVDVTFGCELRSDSSPSLSILSGEAALEYDLVLPCPAIAKTAQFHPLSLISRLSIRLYRQSCTDFIIFSYHLNLTSVRPQVSRCSALSQAPPHVNPQQICHWSFSANSPRRRNHIITVGSWLCIPLPPYHSCLVCICLLFFTETGYGAAFSLQLGIFIRNEIRDRTIPQLLLCCPLATPLASTAIPPEGDGERFGLLVDNRVEFEE